MSSLTLKELLCQLSGFLKPVIDRAVEEPLFRMHHCRNTFTLEVNWTYAKEASKKLEKTAISEKKKMAADFPAKTPSERRHLVRNRLRRERKKAARALRRTTTAKSPITVSPDVTHLRRRHHLRRRLWMREHPGPCLMGKESRHHHRPKGSRCGEKKWNGTPA